METRFSKDDVDRLGRFNVNSYRGEILNLIGYLVLPEIQDDRRIIIDNEDLIGFFVIYSFDKKPRLGFRDLVIEYYLNYNELSKVDKTIIESDRNCINKKDIEDFLLKATIESIDYCKTRVSEICTKWPQRDECLKALGELEDNLDQLYIIKTDFYEKP